MMLRNKKRISWSIKSEKYDMRIYQFIRDDGGFNEWQIVMIEAYPERKTGDELRMYER
jgi:hypothetical protein